MMRLQPIVLRLFCSVVVGGDDVVVVGGGGVVVVPNVDIVHQRLI